MSACWRPLKLNSANDRIPPLLICCTFTQTSYDVYVTDLTHIWNESLDKRAIERRSEDEETSINPVHDAEQLKILLQKLENGLTGTGNTSLLMSSRKGRNRAEPARLVLNIIAALPKPLEPLKWPVRLEARDQAALTSRLTIPLIRAQNSRSKELKRITQILNDKDHVIQKLVDKLETTGADLAQVFAGAAGKNGKPLPRLQANQRVKGLKPFDLETWKMDAKDEESEMEEKVVRVILDEAFDAETGCALGGKSASELPAEWEDWWEHLEEVTVDASTSPHVIRLAKPTMTNNTAKEEEDDFQVQATPPHDDEPQKMVTDKKSPVHATKVDVLDNSTEDDEQDSDVPSQRLTVIPDSFPFSQSAPQSKQLGKIGGIKPRALPKSPLKSKSPEPLLGDSRVDPLLDDETASEDDQSPKRISSQKRAILPKPPKFEKGMLGKIGGKKKETAPTPNSNYLSVAIPQPRPEELTYTARDAPAIKSENSKECPSSEVETRLQTDTAKQKTPQPEETELEKADRKRAEGKRELEEKKKAPPKKKRKF